MINFFFQKSYNDIHESNTLVLMSEYAEEKLL